MKRLKQQIKKDKIAIAAVHLLPTEGYEGFTDYETVLQAAKQDIETAQNAGFDSIIIENNYDLPHEIYLRPETVEFLKRILIDLKSDIKIPFGLSILWNDYKTAFTLAKETGAGYIRIPVFVDTVVTAFGKVEPVAKEAVAYRKQLGCEDVEIFADIHVKHSQILNSETIEESAENAIKAGADALIITGKWTADSPAMEDLENVRKVVNDFPIVIGSGATVENISELMHYSDAAIVGTALKPGDNDVKERNIKSYDKRIELSLAEDFIAEFQESV